MSLRVLASLVLCTVAVSALAPFAETAGLGSLPSGRGLIPTFEIYQQSPGSANVLKHARFAFSNTRDFPIDVTVSFVQENGTIVYDGKSDSDSISIQSGGKRGFTVGGQPTAYVESPVGSPLGTPSLTFTLPPLKSCAIYMRAGKEFVGGDWPTPYLAQLQGNHDGLFPGFRGFGVIEWTASTPGQRGPALIVNGGIWSHGEWADGPELVVNGGMPF